MTQNDQTEECLAQKQSTKNVCEEKTEVEYAGWKGREQRTDTQKVGGVRRQSLGSHKVVRKQGLWICLPSG